MTPARKALEAAARAIEAGVSSRKQREGASLTKVFADGGLVDCTAIADAAIRAFLAEAAHHGWKMTPREATEEMLTAADEAFPGDSPWTGIHPDDITNIHAAMHDAAPSFFDEEG